MASFKLFKTINNRIICRGGQKGCIGKEHKFGRKFIPEGSQVLKISISGAGGRESAHYCEVCMYTVIKDMEKFLEQVTQPEVEKVEEVKEEPDKEELSYHFNEEVPYGCGGY